MIEVDITPASIAKLKAAGIGLPMVGKTALHPQMEFEPPLYVQRVQPRSLVKAGAFCSIASNLSAVTVGRYCAIGPNVIFGANEHPTDWLTVSRLTHVPALNGWTDYLYPDDPSAANKKIQHFTKACPQTHIGNDVWIGQGAFIKAGVTLGDGSIVAANSTVTKDVAPYAIVGGTPAKVIRKRFSDEIIARLLEVQWWRYNLYDFEGMAYADISGSLDRIISQVDAGDVQEYKPLRIGAEEIARIATS